MDKKIDKVLKRLQMILPLKERQDSCPEDVRNCVGSGQLYCCADNLCTEMIFHKDKEIAQHWLIADVANREIFSLKESVTFAAQFFTPLLAERIAPIAFLEKSETAVHN